MLLPASQGQEFFVIYFLFRFLFPPPFFTMVVFRGGSFPLESCGDFRINVGVRGRAPVIFSWSEQNVGTKNLEGFFGRFVSNSMRISSSLVMGIGLFVDSHRVARQRRRATLGPGPIHTSSMAG